MPEPKLDPYPTPTRLKLVAKIVGEQVTGYPRWSRPRAWDAGAREVTARVNELISGGLAKYQDNGEDRELVVLTDAGRAWLEAAERAT